MSLDRYIAQSGLSKSEIARKVGCHPSFLTHVVYGRSKVSLPMRLKIAKVLGHPVEVVFPEYDDYRLLGG